MEQTFYFGGFFLLFALIGLVMAALGLALLALHVWAVVDVAQTPEPAFGPPWDNTKTAWLVGLVVAFFLPVGNVIAVVLWWMQVHKRKQRGLAPERPFWAPARSYPPQPPAPVPPGPPGPPPSRQPPPPPQQRPPA